MCGFVGGLVKSVFGGGGNNTPQMQKIDPVATMTNVDDSTDTTGDEDAATKAKKKRGFASTQLRDWRNQTTVLGNNNNGKNTLG